MIQEVKVNGQPLRRLLEYEIANEPLWASDAGRSNMSGTYTGTFNGYLPSMVLSFGDMSPEDMQYNCDLLESPIILVSFEEKKTKTLLSRYFLGTSISTKVSNYKGRYEGFSISLSAVSKL